MRRIHDQIIIDICLTQHALSCGNPIKLTSRSPTQSSIVKKFNTTLRSYAQLFLILATPPHSIPSIYCPNVALTATNPANKLTLALTQFCPFHFFNNCLASKFAVAFSNSLSLPLISNSREIFDCII